MARRFRLYLFLTLCLLAGMLLVACGTADNKKTAGTTPDNKGQKPKFAMILPGAVEDADYNFLGYQVSKMLQEKLGLETKYQEKVAPAEAERVARGFINEGYSIIAFHGGQFVTTVDKLAKQFPDVSFIIETAGPMPDLPKKRLEYWS